eukprot:344776-Pleurochrysis_carterae.AAC.1
MRLKTKRGRPQRHASERSTEERTDRRASVASTVVPAPLHSPTPFDSTDQKLAPRCEPPYSRRSRFRHPRESARLCASARSRFCRPRALAAALDTHERRISPCTPHFLQPLALLRPSLSPLPGPFLCSRRQDREARPAQRAHRRAILHLAVGHRLEEGLRGARGLGGRLQSGHRAEEAELCGSGVVGRGWRRQGYGAGDTWHPVTTC